MSVTPSAASVDGAEIPISELNQTLNDSTASSLFYCLVAQQGGVRGAGVQATYSRRYAAQQLSLLIERKELEAEITKLGLVRTSLASALAASQITNGLTPQSGGSCTATGSAVVASLTSSYRDLLMTLQVDQDLLSAHLAGASLTDAGVQAYARAHPNVSMLACVSVILTAKRATAASIVHQISTGASFSALARQRSIDPQSAANGGALGCVYPGQFSGQLASVVSKTSVGSVSAPIAFGSNYVILEVTKREPGSASGSALALVSSKANAEAAFFNGIGHNDSVWVNSQYGSWSIASGQYQVIPVSGPPNLDILNPTALTPLGDTYS